MIKLIFLLCSFVVSSFASETILMPSAQSPRQYGANNMYLQTAGGNIVPAFACYTSDGNGNVIPIASGGGGGAVTQGTSPWVISAASLPLPTGAATSASQSTANSSLSTIATNTTGVATAANQTSGNSSLSTIATNTTGAATAANQSTGNSSLSTIATNTTGVATAANQSTANSSLSTIATNTTGVATAANQVTQTSSLGSIVSNTNTPANGSISNNASITTAASTFTAPANAVGFVLEAESGNTANIRWAIGSTATASVGSLAEPGRDTGYIPGSANISVIAISGTQSASVQWIVK